MSLPDKTLGERLKEAHKAYKAIRSGAAAIHARSLTGEMKAERVYLFSDNCVDALAIFTSARGVTGLGQYAKDEYGNQALEFNDSLTALETAMDAYITWVHANMPVSGNGFVEAVSLNATTRKSEDRTLPSGIPMMDALRTHMQAMIGA